LNFLSLPIEAEVRESIAGWVRNGGRLLLLGGRRFEGLESLGLEFGLELKPRLRPDTKTAVELPRTGRIGEVFPRTHVLTLVLPGAVDGTKPDRPVLVGEDDASLGAVVAMTDGGRSGSGEVLVITSVAVELPGTEEEEWFFDDLLHWLAGG